MTAQDVITQLNALCSGDPESAHEEADVLLCHFISAVGYPEVAQAWRSAERRITFWYA